MPPIHAGITSTGRRAVRTTRSATDPSVSGRPLVPTTISLAAVSFPTAAMISAAWPSRTITWTFAARSSPVRDRTSCRSFSAIADSSRARNRWCTSSSSRVGVAIQERDASQSSKTYSTNASPLFARAIANPASSAATDVGERSLAINTRSNISSNMRPSATHASPRGLAYAHRMAPPSCVAVERLLRAKRRHES